ncbi:RadC family protein [Pirellulaceae bacterium SH449]
MTDERTQKLKKILYAIKDLDSFSTETAKSICSDLHPAYVTRVIKQLSKEGLLDKHLESASEVFRWSKGDQIDIDSWISNQVHGEQIKSSPEQERPRELLLQNGADSLTDAQLIAILIRVGIPGESAIHGGRRISNRFPLEQLAKLADASLQELRSISKTIRKDSYAQIMAGVELGRRISILRDRSNKPPERIRGSDDAIRFCMREFHRLAVDGLQEEFHIVTLDTQLGPIGTHHITTGTLDASLVHPREVFRPAIRDSASAIILVHNHPSGDPTPSREDRSVTERLTQAGDLLGIRVLDHIVVARESGRSVLAS